MRLICRENCLFDDNNLVKAFDIVQKVQLNTNSKLKQYVGVIETTLKDKLYKHKYSFVNPKGKPATVLIFVGKELNSRLFPVFWVKCLLIGTETFNQ